MSTFTIQFPEYDIANKLKEEFSQKDNFSVAIPLSRQQKYYDLLLVNGAKNKFVTIQVKSSRTYLGREKDIFDYYSWFNRFDIKDNYSDFYFLYMTYPFFDENGKPRAKWNTKILVFNQKEMKQILDQVKTKSGKPDLFFSFGFNQDKDSKIYGQRGFSSQKDKDYSANLLENRITELRTKFKG